jgi:uncharacterized LabA/DUF88 family protein
MKGFAVLAAVIGLLSAPIQAQAEFNISEALRRDAAQKAWENLSPFEREQREQEIQRVIQRIEAMKREMYEMVQRNLAPAAARNPVERYQTEQSIKQGLEIHNRIMMDRYQDLNNSRSGRY